MQQRLEPRPGRLELAAIDLDARQRERRDRMVGSSCSASAASVDATSAWPARASMKARSARGSGSFGASSAARRNAAAASDVRPSPAHAAASAFRASTLAGARAVAFVNASIASAPGPRQQQSSDVDHGGCVAGELERD